MSGHRLTLRFKEDVQPYLQDVTDLLYNFEKLHDLSVVMELRSDLVYELS